MISPQLTRDDVHAFCQLCSWTVEAWSTHRAFQDHAALNGTLVRNHAYLLNRLSAITPECTLQQIMKLHDPAQTGGRDNLSISFVVEAGNWDSSTRDALDSMKRELDVFAECLRVARNRLLSHNDREVILAGVPIGGFPQGADDCSRTPRLPSVL